MNKIRKSFLWKIENDAIIRYVPGPGKYPRMKTKLEESEL